MATNFDLGNPTPEEWLSILEEIDLQQQNDAVIYKAGSHYYKALFDTYAPKQVELVSRQQIMQIVESNISSTAFNPLAVSKIRRSCLLKTEGIIPKWVVEFKELESDLNALIAEKNSDKLEKSVEQFVEKYGKKYNITEFYFTPLLKQNRQERLISYVREKVLNRAFNILHNEVKIRQFIQAKQKEILAQFGSPDIQQIPQQELTVDIVFHGQETHNGGKRPAEIKFSHKGKVVLTVMYKPRTAALDTAVQKLFKELNFPNYKIISYEDENCSIWEYIEGKNMLLSWKDLSTMPNELKYNKEAIIAPETFIKYSGLFSTQQQKILLDELKKIKDILLVINLTDLHGENVRLSKVDQHIYPVDLEVLDPRQATFLMIEDYILTSEKVEKRRNKAFKKLSTTDLPIVKKWISETDPLSKLPFRNVLVHTKALVPLNGLDDLQEAVDSLEKIIDKGVQRGNYEMDKQQRVTLKNRLFLDLLNGDVPFFTQLKGIIYYGFPNERCIIATRKMEKA